MARFANLLEVKERNDGLWVLLGALIYYSDIINDKIVVPKHFTCDFESVPRVPIVFSWLGYTNNRAGVLHDYLYRKDSKPVVTREQADEIYKEACLAENKIKQKGAMISVIKWLGVRVGSGAYFHKIKVKDIPVRDTKSYLPEEFK